MRSRNGNRFDVSKNCPCGDNKNCPLKDLKIALIGGLDRLENRYRSAFCELGAEAVHFHPGHCAGAGAGRLRKVADCADIVVYITSINSHNALQVVKAQCRKSGKRFIVVRQTGPSRVSRETADVVNAG